MGNFRLLGDGGNDFKKEIQLVILEIFFLMKRDFFLLLFGLNGTGKLSTDMVKY